MSLSRSSSHNSLERRLSIEETYALADTARRKSSSGRNNLRQKLGHAQVLEIVEDVIRSSPPPSPKQHSSHLSSSSSRHIQWSGMEVSKRYTPPSWPAEEVDEYGYSYDDGEEDLDGLSLVRTASRRD